MVENNQHETDCRIVTNDDMPQVLHLWQTCFDDTMKFVLWYFARYWKAENTIGIFERNNGVDTLQASAQVIPYNLQIRNTNLPCGYIVGVDTAPEARNRGYAKRLLKESLCLQRERGQAISLLMPFEGQFYYRYGWPFCYFHQRIITDAKELRCIAKPWGTVRKVDLFEAQDELQRIYGMFAMRYHGTVNRTAEQWRLQLEDAQIEHTACFLIEDEQQQVQGYFLWTPLKEKCFVREIAWSHERAKAGMLYYLMQNIPEDQKLWIDLPEDDGLKYRMAAAKNDIVLYPFLMARIVDVKQCLEALWYPDLKAELLLTVQDDFAEWNTGNYHMIIENNRAQVTVVGETVSEDLKQSNIPSGTISIEGLSQMVMGTCSADTLVQQEILCCDTEQTPVPILQSIWPKQTNFINEYY